MIYNIFAGMIIGIGFILPGVSGAVIAVILNRYESCINAINNIMKTPKKSLSLLVPIGIGMGIGVVLLGNLLKYVFNEYYMQSCFVFIGLILGSIPVLFKKAEEKGKVNKLLLVISFVLALLLFILGKNKFDLSPSSVGGFESYIRLFLTGVLFISGKIIPGISSSFMMMLVGMYDYILDILSNPLVIFTPKIIELIPFIIGVIVGIILIVKLMNIALNKFYSTTYSIIIGFVIGSFPAIYPGFTFDLTGLLSILLLIISFIISYNFSTFNKKR